MAINISTVHDRIMTFLITVMEHGKYFTGRQWTLAGVSFRPSTPDEGFGGHLVAWRWMWSCRPPNTQPALIVVLSDNIEALFRNVPPPLFLALAMTETHEKAVRGAIMRERNCSELEAVLHTVVERTRPMISGRLAKRKLSWNGKLSTHCRTGCSGKTSSTSSAALSVMCRAPQLGQKPRRLQLRILEDSGDTILN